MAADKDLHVSFDIEALSREMVEKTWWLKELNEKMTSINAQLRASGYYPDDAPEEEFDLSALDYDELLSTYGDDPVLLTILKRMHSYFTNEARPRWVKFDDWPNTTIDTSKWSTSTRLDTTSVVSEPFTLKYDTTGYGVYSNQSNTVYTVTED